MGEGTLEQFRVQRHAESMQQLIPAALGSAFTRQHGTCAHGSSPPRLTPGARGQDGVMT
jgi:hypothetical protein